MEQKPVNSEQPVVNASGGPARYRDPRAERMRVRGMIAEQRQAVAPTGEAMRRAQVAQRRGAVGTRLVDRVQAQVRNEAGRRGIWMGPGAGGALLALVAGGGGFLAGGFLVMLLFAVPAFAVGIVVLVLVNRRRGVRFAQAELASAAQFDDFLESRSARLTDVMLTRLNEIKADLARLFPALQAGQSAGVYGADDVFFVHQAVSRYLPDALDPYLALQTPAANAQAAVVEQLDLVAAKLRALSAKLDDMHVRKLLQNQAFLKRKLEN